MIILFLFLGISILIRGPQKRINQMFFIFLLLIALGLINNIIYRTIDDPQLNIIMNQVSIFFPSLSIVFLFLFNLIILKSDKIITDKLKLILIIIWVILCSMFFVIAAIIPDSVTFNTDNNPVWRWEFAAYGLIIDQLSFTFILIVNVQIYKRFEHEELKKKYLYTIASVLMFDWVLVGNFINNWWSNDIFRQIFPITSLIAIPACIFLYIGVKRET